MRQLIRVDISFFGTLHLHKKKHVSVVRQIIINYLRSYENAALPLVRLLF